MKTEVCNYMVNNFTQENDLILDPFSGYGTTAFCAKNANRNYIGFEISLEYVNLSLKRLDTLF